MTDLTVALISIARPTFDVPLAQSVADTVLAQMTAAGFTVVGTGAELLMDAAGAQRAVAALQVADFDLLVLLQASFADSSMAVDVVQTVQARRVPVLLWSVPDERDGGRLRLNSLCGINLAAHALTRRQLGYEYIHTPPAGAEALVKIGQLARAGRAVRTLRQARIGLVGDHPVGFDTCDYEPTALAALFDAQVTPIALETFLAQAADAPQHARDLFLAKAGAHVANLAELAPSATNGTAGVYAALAQAARQEGLAGIAVRCWPEFFTELGCAACGAMSMLNEEMCPASCEADVNGTITSLILQGVSGEQAFVTDLVSIEADSDTGVLWHCGLAPISMADPAADVIGTIHSNRKLPLLFEFPLKPGRVTLARLHRTGQGSGSAAYRLVIGGGEMVRAPKSFGGTSGVIRFDAPATTVLDRIMAHGLEHHLNITYGDVRESLRAFARLVGLTTIELT